VDFVQSEPKFTIQITETSLVIAPVKEKINRTVQSLLEHCPTPTGCCLVRFDGVHTVFSSARFVDISTVFVSCRICKRKEMIEILRWSDFVPETNRGDPAGAVYGEWKVETAKKKVTQTLQYVLAFEWALNSQTRGTLL